MIGALVAGITGSGGASLSSYESIATASLSGISTYTFSSIPSTFKHLQVRMMVRNSDASAGNNNLYLQFNGDTGSNYSFHQLYGNGTSAAASGLVSQTSTPISYTVNNGEAANLFGVGILDVLDYTSSSKNKTVRCLTGFDLNGSGTVAVKSTAWLSTNAITSLTLINGGATNFASGSSIALYGIKEA